MATSVATDTPLWVDGLAFDSNELRIADASIFNHNTTSSSNSLAVRTGVLQNVSGTTAIVSAPGGMVVRVTPRTYVIQGNDSATQGAYRVSHKTNIDLTVASANPTLPRLDRVCATIVDNGDDTTTSVIQIITGTAAASPSLPALPNNSCHIAQVSVTAGATLPVVINDVEYTGMNTGILPVSSVSTYPTSGPTGFLNDLGLDQLMYHKAGTVYPAMRFVTCTSATRPANKLLGTHIYETDTGTIRMWDSADWRVVLDTTWISYTPSWTNSGSPGSSNNGSLVGKYARQGKMVDVMIKQINGSTVFAGPGIQYWSLPFAAASTAYAENIGSFVIYDYGGSHRSGSVYYADGPKCYGLYPAIVPTDQVVHTAVTSTAPITWTQNDTMTIRCRYEIA